MSRQLSRGPADPSAPIGWRPPERRPGAAGRPSRRQLTSAVVEQYLPIVLLLAVVAVLRLFSVLGSRSSGPGDRPAPRGPLRVGHRPPYQPAARFPVRFYLVAMIFIIFDIEIIFLYPWAVMYHQLGTFGLAEMAVVRRGRVRRLRLPGVQRGPRLGSSAAGGGRPPADLSRTTDGHGAPGASPGGAVRAARRPDRSTEEGEKQTTSISPSPRFLLTGSDRKSRRRRRRGSSR